MVERLKEYREQFAEELLEIETANDEEYIADEVQAFEKQLRETLAEKRKKAVTDKQNEIAVIDKLIAIETEKTQKSVITDFFDEPQDVSTDVPTCETVQ